MKVNAMSAVLALCLVISNVSAQSLDSNGPGNNILASSRDLVASGSKLVTIIDDGRPADVTSMGTISITPHAGNKKIALYDMENFSAPVLKKFDYSLKNSLGQEVVKFRYGIHYSHGGSYEGKGAYLANLSVIPFEVKAQPGYSVSANYKLSGIMNIGTKDAPVAAVFLKLNYKVEGNRSSNEQSETFFISGSGKFHKY